MGKKKKSRGAKSLNCTVFRASVLYFMCSRISIIPSHFPACWDDYAITSIRYTANGRTLPCHGRQKRFLFCFTGGQINGITKINGNRSVGFQTLIKDDYQADLGVIFYCSCIGQSFYKRLSCLSCRYLLQRVGFYELEYKDCGNGCHNRGVFWRDL